MSVVACASAPSVDAAVEGSECPAALLAGVGRALGERLTSEGQLLAVKDAATGAYLHVNGPMAQWIGLAAHEVIGRTDAELLSGALLPALRAADTAAMAQEGGTSHLDQRLEWRGDVRDFRIDRHRFDIDGRAVLLSVWADRAAVRRQDEQLHAALTQLEAEQRANQQLRRELSELTQREAATGLYNRAHFDDQLRREIDLSTREHREFALVAIAVDDVRGDHADDSLARDLVLDTLGRLLRGNTRAMDASCRLDNQRFAVLLSGVGLSTAHARMEGLRRECATQIVMHHGQPLRFTVSMGVASFPHTAQSQDELLDACETALTHARQRGGNRVGLASITFERSTGFAD